MLPKRVEECKWQRSCVEQECSRDAAWSYEVSSSRAELWITWTANGRLDHEWHERELALAA